MAKNLHLVPEEMDPQAQLALLQQQRQKLEEQEPEGIDTPEYFRWLEACEAIEDQMDEILDAME